MMNKVTLGQHFAFVNLSNAQCLSLMQRRGLILLAIPFRFMAIGFIVNQVLNARCSCSYAFRRIQENSLQYPSNESSLINGSRKLSLESPWKES